MQPADIPECVEVIAAHPIIGARYGPTIGDLSEAWLRLADSDARIARVFYADEEQTPPIRFVGVSVFVSDEFVGELKTVPGFWFGPELARRVVRGQSPVLSDRQLRDANSSDGVNLLVWEGCMRLGVAPADTREIMNSFIDDHRGYRVKEIISSQIESSERLLWTLQTGSSLWNCQAGRYVDILHEDPNDVIATPHIVGVTREIERERYVPGSWLGELFAYDAPQFGFSRSEQHMVRAALVADTCTDKELAKLIGVSLPTIKKTWLSVYRRVATRRPDIIPDGPHRESERGKEKRRRLFAYIRAHPEELRPISPKLLKRT
jgi:hypothetical protein